MRELIATLDNNGVDRAVVAAASPWGDYNDYDYILAALRAHPQRLRGTAIFKRPMERFELEAMSREGFIGVRLPFIGLPKLPDITHSSIARCFAASPISTGTFIPMSRARTCRKSCPRWRPVASSARRRASSTSTASNEWALVVAPCAAGNDDDRMFKSPPACREARCAGRLWPGNILRAPATPPRSP